MEPHQMTSAAMNSMGVQTLEHVFNNVTGLECPDSWMAVAMERVATAPPHEDKPGVRFPASKIGRPWIVQVLDQWFPGKRKTTVGQVLNMVNGNIIQEVAAAVLDLCNYDYRAEVNVHSYGVEGHADLVVYLNDVTVVLECKGMAAHIVSSFCNNPSDQYGYLSQLAFYSHCIQQQSQKPVAAAFLVFDRSASKFRLVEISPGMVDQKVKRIQTGTSILVDIAPHDYRSLIEKCAIPPTVGGTVP